MSTILIQNGSIVTEKGIEKSDLLIKDSTLAEVAPGLPGNADEIIDATDKLIFPGFIDCHVHFREPGYEEAEDLKSGALSARSGGVTTVCEMPNTNPPTSSREALADKLRRAKEVKDCDIRFFFNVSTEEHLKELDTVDPKHICGVKLYFDHSTGNLGADKKAIEGAFELCAKKKIQVVAHCEDPEVNGKALEQTEQSGVEAHSKNRPPESEMEAIDEAIALSRKYGTHLHVAHLSTKFGLDLVKKAKADKLPVTCEVAPHHLFLSVDDYQTLGALAKMNPPLRTKDHCQALMAGVLDGTVDCVSTDHAPHTREAKAAENPLEAPSGVPGVETMIPLLLNTNITPGKLLSLCFTRPNQIFSLGKPGLTSGKPVDLVIVDPKAQWKIQAANLHSKCGWTPYEGWEVTGKIERVITG